jgi:hypothetical protein
MAKFSSSVYFIAGAIRELGRAVDFVRPAFGDYLPTQRIPRQTVRR